MFNYMVLCGMMYGVVTAEPPLGIGNGIKPLNILGGPEQHASFSFIRPGLTQTSYSFNGPSSHQAFSSTIGNSQLAQRVLPNVANALSYRNPGLGYFANVPISMGFASSSHLPGSVTATSAAPSLPYNQLSLDQAMSLDYWQHGQPDLYQNQLSQLLALRQAQLLQHSTQGQAHHSPIHQSQPHEQLQLQHQHQDHHQGPQQQQHQHQPQNLLGVAYSSAPAVSHVKIHGNGYKFNF